LLPKEKEVELPLLKVLQELGGQGKTKDIYYYLISMNIVQWKIVIKVYYKQVVDDPIILLL